MPLKVLVTGATGRAGANICRQLVERGDAVRALARPGADTGPLSALGVEIVNGDVTDAEDVRRAAAGCDAAIHCAALLGGASRTWPISRPSIHGAPSTSSTRRRRKAWAGLLP